MPKPEQQITRWCSNPDTILDPNPIGAPTNGQQNNGFTPNQALNRQVMNYMFNKLWAWAAWFAGHRPERGHYGPDHPVADNRGLHRAIEQNGAAMQAADDPDRDTRDGNNRVRLYELRSPRPSTNERWRMYADNGAGTGADNTGRLWITWNAWWDADFDGGRWVKDDAGAASMAVRMETDIVNPEGSTTYLTQPGGLAVWEDNGWLQGAHSFSQLRLTPSKTITRVLHPAAARVVAGSPMLADAFRWITVGTDNEFVFPLELPPGAVLRGFVLRCNPLTYNITVSLFRADIVGTPPTPALVAEFGSAEFGWTDIDTPGINEVIAADRVYWVKVDCSAAGQYVGPLTITYEQTEAVA